jgi:hypothetical protein
VSRFKWNDDTRDSRDARERLLNKKFLSTRQSINPNCFI